MKNAIESHQCQTLVKLNEISCLSMERLAGEAYSIPATEIATPTATNNSATVANTPASPDEVSDDSFTSSPSSSAEHRSLDAILKSSSILSSDKVGHLGILDLCSKTVSTMLKKQLPGEEYDAIVEASSLQQFQLTTYAQELVDAFIISSLSTRSLRDIIRQVAHRNEYDPVIHHDAGFVETTARHFLDLMDSPRNPLMYPLGERSACIYTTSFIMNQLFLSNNDIAKMN